MDSVTILRKFFRLLKSEKKDILYIYLYALFAGIVTLSLPLGIQAIMNFITTGEVSISWIVLIIFVVLGTAIAGWLQVMQISITEILQQRIFVKAAFEFAYRIPKIQAYSVIRYYPPELMNRFFDVITIQKGLPKILMDFSTALLQIIFGLILLSFYHPLFILFGLLLLGILFVIIRFSGPRGLQSSLDESKYKYHVVHWLEELARTLGTFKLAGKTKLPLEKTDHLVNNYLTSRKSHFKVLLFQFWNVIAFKTFITACLLILGSYLVFNGQINIGQFVASEIIIILMLASAEKLIFSLETIYDVLTGVEKISNVTQLPLENEKGISFQEISREGQPVGISTLELSYQFPGTKRKTLDKVSFDVVPGNRTCITGPNGSGKTTLINILSGVLTNFEGSLLFNGQSIGSLNISSLRNNIGDNLSQEVIFEGTIWDNITLGKSNLTYEDILNVTKAMGLESFISNMEKGILTELVPEDKRISRSITKKIMLARSIIDKPKFLVFDDFLSSFDEVTKVQLRNYFLRKDHPWTLIAVSYDIDFAKNCDSIIYLDEGKVTFSGTYSTFKDTYNEL